MGSHGSGKFVPSHLFQPARYHDAVGPYLSVYWVAEAGYSQKPSPVLLLLPGRVVLGAAWTQTSGIIVAFSFGKGAYEEVARAKLHEHLDIRLTTVKELVGNNRNVQPEKSKEQKELG